jgi:hypothetical protein
MRATLIADCDADSVGQSLRLDIDVGHEGFDRFPTGSSLLNGGKPDLHGEPSCFQAFCEDALGTAEQLFQTSLGGGAALSIIATSAATP